MNPVFLLSGKTVCIRRLKQFDLQDSYYDLMSLLSASDRSILRTREIVDNLENEYIYFVVEDMNTKMIVGTGTIIIANTSTKISQIGCIENIMTRKDYEKIGLENIIFRHLRDYCLNTKHCIKVKVNCVV
tara:strand:+ start:699 stop:1088 length:390 start_codon:yes stop_codon:yes gene_type:complete